MHGFTSSVLPPCPLCSLSSGAPFFRDKRRQYLRCSRCQLIYVPPWQHPGRGQEIAEYKLHQNCPEDLRYRRFLNRLAEPLSQQLSPASEGLDFGCGPGPTLSVIFSELGHSMTDYDPFFRQETSALLKRYDFICATEVVEHLQRPGMELSRLWTLLQPNGWLGIMTKLALDASAFSRWHYRSDPTHVVFFSRPTFQWLASLWHARLLFVGKDVILLQKKTEVPFSKLL